MRDWIRDYLGPSLEAAGYGRLKMMACDFNRYTLPYYVEPCFADPDCSKYVDGVAVHWYSDDVDSPDVLLATRDLDPSKFILYSEACNGLRVPTEEAIQLGDWTRGERYLYNILETADEFYKQPMFYALAHVSKFFKRGDLRFMARIGQPRSGLLASSIDMTRLGQP
ncbi:putative glucosylceramidase 3 [Hyalella azteca]|uniref:Glucosylceramidase n=1 Tax=Hyalella azteca TaxID=294128 RepID=A0A979FYJ0_HYAAZ|nr:putative glucosylceramidase 3 [Hyalella azteca]